MESGRNKNRKRRVAEEYMIRADKTEMAGDLRSLGSALLSTLNGMAATEA